MKMNIVRRLQFLLCIILPLASIAQIRLPRLVRDSMVLQRDAKVKVWGWASPGESVEVRFRDKRVKTAAGTDGKWTLLLPSGKAGGPFSMELKGQNTIVLKDILVGDVWLCAGQSNMVHQMALHNVRYERDIAQANYPEIRHFWIPTTAGLSGPEKDLKGGYWKSANPQDVNDFSAVAYFFARKLYLKYHVPIGLINASVGGTPIEAWMSEEGLAPFPRALSTLERNRDTVRIARIRRTADSLRASRRSRDLGLMASPKWFEEAYVPKGWQNINVPGYWEDQGVKDLDGVVWYRKEIDVPASMTGIQARVFLGRIVDADFLYVNGELAGNTTYQYPQRRYMLKAGMLRPGKNTLVVRVINQIGKGGFVPDKPYYIEAAGQKIDLKGDWQYKVGEAYTRPVLEGGISLQNQPAALYNAMVAPFAGYAIRGVLWYQGESNAGNPAEYKKLLPALIADWRSKWQQPGLPFIYVQLPNYMDAAYVPGPSNWAEMREASLQTLATPGTAMAVTIDLGEWNDIHPDNKKDVGERLALAAQKLVYGEKNLVASGPLFQSARVEKDRIIVSFSSTGSGLKTSDGEEPARFEIAGSDRKFVWARARIEGNTVVVWSEDIPQPAFVRYAWADNPFGANLCNKEGLPASPFRTDP
ncbi:sialate O-acetylesterase [Arcticibacter sp. MXS-1]|uniref:sialate O-acetylesterase n=1 Tax=Arcticibacter sp. MXS-1 TaxID=3341726 RepID=UPI0035A87299